MNKINRNKKILIILSFIVILVLLSIIIIFHFSPLVSITDYTTGDIKQVRYWIFENKESFNNKLNKDSNIEVVEDNGSYYSDNKIKVNIKDNISKKEYSKDIAVNLLLINNHAKEVLYPLIKDYVSENDWYSDYTNVSTDSDHTYIDYGKPDSEFNISIKFEYDSNILTINKW